MASIIPPPTQVPVMLRGAPLEKVKMPENCQWLIGATCEAVRAVPIVACADGQLIEKCGGGDLRMVNGAGRFFEIVFIRISWTSRANHPALC